MKTKLVSILLLLCLVLTGCGNDTTADTTVPETPDNTAAAIEYLKSFYMNEAGTATAVDYTRFGIVRLDKEVFTVTWTTNLSEDLIKIVPGENNIVTIDINEECQTETPYTLTATVTDAAGHTASHSWEHILPKGQNMVEIVEQAYALKSGESMDNEVSLTGKIISIDSLWDSYFQNITVTMQITGAEDKPITCYRLKGDGAQDLAIGNIITVSGKIKNYSGTIEFDSGCILTAVETGTAVEAPTDVAQILQAAYALGSGAQLPYQVTLTGTVTEITTPFNPDYYNISVKIVMEGFDDMPMLCYRLKGDGVADIAAGDTITVTGMVTNYNGTIEFNAGCQMLSRVSGGGIALPPSDDAQQILSDAAKLTAGQKLQYRATLTGKVVSIDNEYSAQYHNITVTIKVNGKNIQCYRMVGDGIEDIAVGDTITVSGIIENYNGKLEFGAKSTMDSRIPG